MRWLSRLTTFAIIGVIAGAVMLGAVRLARPPAARGGFVTYALFRDAAGLPVGSRVVIAGVNVGRIERLTIDGNQARVTMRLATDVVLCDDAWATKKATSALGDNYVELSPGESDPAAAGGCAPPRRRLRSGEPVPRVVEAASTERVLRGIQNAMPRLDEGMASAEAFMDEGREWVAGPFAARIAQLDRDLSDDAIGGPLRDAVQTADRLDRWTADLATDVAGLAPTTNRRLDDFANDIASVTGDLREARTDVTDGLGEARARIDEVDPFLEDTADDLLALADPGRERPGTLHRLIHDPELADDLADTTESIASFTNSISKFKNVIGFRMEVNVVARQPRYYVSVEIAARPDQFYLVELEKGHWGDVPEPAISDETGDATWTRRAIIREKLRLTAQWGKRFGTVAVRAGIKDSMFGAGIDATLMGGQLKLSGDVMESSFDRTPRVKLAAAMAVYRTLYVVGGIDDALVAGATLPIAPSADEPIQFTELHYGRDVFLGLHLNFTDTDMERLLYVYGGLLGALLTQ